MNKPETAFTKLLVSRFDETIYVEKTNNPYRKGTPDLYLEGVNIMWAEVKHITKPWTVDRISSKICSTANWTHQRHWLERAHIKGHRTKVIVGVGSGKKTQCYLLDYPYSFKVDSNLLLSIDEAVADIQEELNSCVLPTQNQTLTIPTPLKLVVPLYV